MSADKGAPIIEVTVIIVLHFELLTMGIVEQLWSFFQLHSRINCSHPLNLVLVFV